MQDKPGRFHGWVQVLKKSDPCPSWGRPFGFFARDISISGSLSATAVAALTLGPSACARPLNAYVPRLLLPNTFS